MADQKPSGRDAIVAAGHGDLPVDMETLAAIMDDLNGDFAEAVTRIAALEKRLAEVETRGVGMPLSAKDLGEVIAKIAKEAAKREIDKRGLLRYRGTFQRADAYSRGDCCTSGGSLFSALRSTSGEAPGSSDAWQLIAKGGH